MANVKLVVTAETTEWDMRDKVDVFVDGKLVGGGYYGGAPEDNSRGRDYSWVEKVIVDLGKALGAEVSTQFVDLT